MDCNFYRSKCSKCGTELSVPILTNNSNGQYIFYGSDGRTFRILDLVSSEGVKRIEAIIIQSGLSSIEQLHPKFNLLHQTAAILSDSSDMCHFSTNFLCPNCGQHTAVFSTSDYVERHVLEDVSFNLFLSMSFDEQISKVKMVVKEELLAKFDDITRKSQLWTTTNMPVSKNSFLLNFRETLLTTTFFLCIIPLLLLCLTFNPAVILLGIVYFLTHFFPVILLLSIWARYSDKKLIVAIILSFLLSVIGIHLFFSRFLEKALDNIFTNIF